MRTLDSKGFSLLQVIVASSVVGALTLAGTQMMRDQQKLAKLTSQRFEEEYILSNIKRILSDPQSCRETFSSLTKEKTQTQVDYLIEVFTPKGSTQQARLFLYKTYPSSGQVYGNENVRIEQLTLINQGQNLHGSKGTLNVSFDRDLLFEGQNKHTEEIPLKLRWGDDGALQSCALLSQTQNTDPHWQLERQNQHYFLSPKNNRALVIRASKDRKASPMAPQSTHLGDLRASLPSLKTLRCRPETKGLFVYDQSQQKLVYCHHEGQWKALGEAPTELKDPKEFVVQPQQNVTQVTQALICSLKRAENLPLSATCSMSSPQKIPPNRVNIDPGTWTLRLDGQTRTNSKCVYQCYF